MAKQLVIVAIEVDGGERAADYIASALEVGLEGGIDNEREYGVTHVGQVRVFTEGKLPWQG